MEAVPPEVIRISEGAGVCPDCGSQTQVRRGLCLHCLLRCGLDRPGETADTLGSALQEIGLNDADWRIGNYQILEEIGRGGMGVIYRARQRNSQRIVALKRVLSFHTDSNETLARFRREAEAAASLDHPNILPIYEVGEDENGVPFFSMKFASGGSLVQAAGELRRNPREIVRLMAKITRAVQYAHRQGILHRDLKPGNILLDGRGEPMVSDFGLAKWLDSSSDLTRTLTIFGTPGYIAPEQAKRSAAALTPAADVYSLGAILFDLLTGRPPFLGEHALAVIQQADQKIAPRLRSLVPNADRDLETICGKCLEREAPARYRSADDLATDFERWLEGRPIAARPVSFAARAWRWTKRDPLLATAVTACGVLGTVAIIWHVQNREITASSIARQNSVAIIPFLDLDHAALDDAGASNLATQLSKALAKLGPSRVTFVSSDRLGSAEPNEQMRQAARLSGARMIITGSRRRTPTGEHVVVRVLDAEGNPIARDAIDTPNGRATNILPDRFAEKLHSALGKPESSGIHGNEDPVFENQAARSYFVIAQDLVGRQNLPDLDRGIDALRKCIEVEPESALAHATLARFSEVRAHYENKPETLDEARKEVGLALRLNPDLGDAHRALCGLYYHEGRLDEAWHEQVLAIEADGPNVRSAGIFGDLLKLTGRPDLALSWFKIMAHWEHRPADISWMAADCWSDLCDDERAAALYRQVSDLHPELPEGWIGLCRLSLLNGRFQEAHEICESNRSKYEGFAYPRQIAAQIAFFSRDFKTAEAMYQELGTKEPDGGGQFYGAVSYRSALGYLRFQSSRPEAVEILNQEREKERARLKTAPRHPEVLYRLAGIESSLGNLAASADYFKEAIASGWIDYRSAALDPRFDNVRLYPAFQASAAKLVAHVAELRRNVK